MILAGDVGGTKTNIALFRASGPGDVPARIRSGKYDSRQHGGLETIISAFLEAGETPEAACFGVAGPVIGDRSETPNLPWVIDAGRISAQFGIRRVVLVNDLVATAIRGGTLGPNDVESLNGRIDQNTTDPKLVIAAGTGLGLAAVVRSGSKWITLPSEGGHADLPAENAEQVALVAYLGERHHHVSVERAVSGPGLATIFGFLVDTGRAAPNPEVRAAIEQTPDRAPQIVAEHGLAGTCVASVEALRLFVEFYGAVAGNFALTFLATGGVLLGGGIAPKILPALKDGRFMRSFTNKGRFRELMENTAVAVILDSETALLGAAIRARRELDGSGTD
jgi:glucokinase